MSKFIVTTIVESECKYIGIARWLYENNMTICALHRKLLCVGYGKCRSNVDNMLRGKARPTFDFICAMIEVTGMTFEQLFLEE